MEELEIGKKYIIHSYKHNGNIHRAWDEAILLDIRDDHYVFGNDRTKVTESDGRMWKTKEPAILYFFKNRWFNIIGQLKDYGISLFGTSTGAFLTFACIAALFALINTPKEDKK